MAWSKGKTLKNDRYTIQEILGRGRFSVTYLAKNSQNHHLVVIKTPKDVFLKPHKFKQLQENIMKSK